MNRQELNEKLNELEPYAELLRERLKKDNPKAMGKNICSPSASYDDFFLRPEIKEMKEFMVHKLSFALLKTQLLKECYTYRSGRWMMRLKAPDNKYAENCIAVDVNLLNGYEHAEVIFFADSAADKKVVEAELAEVLGKKSLQELLYEYIDSEPENLSACFDEDEVVIWLKELIEEANKVAATSGTQK